MCGVEAVVDKDLAAARLAIALDADMLLLLTDVPALFDGYGTPHARPIRRASTRSLRAARFPAGSMGPKVEAACRFATATGGRAAIGALAEAPALVTGAAGTVIAAAPGRDVRAGPGRAIASVPRPCPARGWTQEGAHQGRLT